MCLIHFPYEIFLIWTSFSPTFSYCFDEILDPVANSSCMPCPEVKLDIEASRQLICLQNFDRVSFLLSSLHFDLWNLIMSYAQDAGAGASFGSNSGPQSKDKFYNEKMVVCLIKGFTYEQLA